MVSNWEGSKGLGEKGKGIKKYTVMVTELSRGCKLQHREYSQ